MNTAVESSAAEEKHLDWSAKQGRILTDRGNALKYYSDENGFPFSVVVRYYVDVNLCLKCVVLNSIMCIWYALGMSTLSLGKR